MSARWSLAERRRIGALALALAALGGCSMKGLIYPVPAVPVGPPPTGFEEVELDLGAHGSAVLWLRSAAAPGRPLVLFFHGNGENLETLRRAGLVAELGGLGAALALADYPGYGRSRGAPSEEANAAAARAAFDHLGERLPGRPRIVVGWSLGAAVAAALAADPERRPAAVGLFSAWTRLADVGERHFPRWLVRLALDERYDTLAAAPRIDCPALVAHGTADAIIPFEQGAAVAAAIPGARWLPVPGAGHNDLYGRAELWEALAGLVEDAARGVGGGG